ncbi:hypothetical protein DFJ73DRAFT_35311 [Zopfochytrium polystomum]|nr:hypothetical protein DFJ73DRAFT_35311 [Zopfochytrium polystomum]
MIEDRKEGRREGAHKQRAADFPQASMEANVWCPRPFSLSCWMAIASPRFGRAVIWVSSALYLLAAIGIAVFAVRFVRTRPTRPRPFLRGIVPNAMETCILVSILVSLSGAISLTYLRLSLQVPYGIFQGIEYATIGITISVFLYAFIKPMIHHVDGLAKLLPYIWLTSIPPILDGCVAIWTAVLEDQMSRESDLARLAELGRLHDAAGLLDTVFSSLLAIADMAFFVAAYLSFRRAIKNLGPSLLLRARTRETVESAESARTAVAHPSEFDSRAYMLHRPSTPVTGAADPLQKRFPTPATHVSVYNPHHPGFAAAQPEVLYTVHGQQHQQLLQDCVILPASSPHSPPQDDSPQTTPVSPPTCSRATTASPTPPRTAATASLEAFESEIRTGSIRVCRSVIGWAAVCLGVSTVALVVFKLLSPTVSNGLDAFYVWVIGVMLQYVLGGFGIAAFYIVQFVLWRRTPSM